MPQSLVRFTCWILLFSVLVDAHEFPHDPDMDRTLSELIQSRGFAVEQHSAETDDGYILTLFRIVNHHHHHWKAANLKPILVQHGLFGSAADFCMNSPFLKSNNSNYGDNIAFALMQTQRYDVWLGNSRGNSFSRRHRKYTPNSKKFWQFTWDEMAMYDLPAVIKYILKETGHDTLPYVGFSQGTTEMFTLLSLKPEYAQIVQPFVALAPIAYLAHTRGVARSIAQFQSFFRLIGGEFFMSDYLVNRFAEEFCPLPGAEILCQNIMFLVCGFDRKNLNETRIGVYYHFIPSSSSSWNLAHFCQLMKTEKFQHFDYGSKASNMEHYGTSKPPLIPLENIPKNAKIAFFRGANDLLSTKQDVDHLKTIFNQSGLELIEDHLVEDPKWTHLDFLIGKNSGKLFIDKMIDVLDQYVSD